jgi:hypothetical protein
VRYRFLGEEGQISGDLDEPDIERIKFEIHCVPQARRVRVRDIESLDGGNAFSHEDFRQGQYGDESFTCWLTTSND